MTLPPNKNSLKKVPKSTNSILDKGKMSLEVRPTKNEH